MTFDDACAPSSETCHNENDKNIAVSHLPQGRRREKRRGTRLVIVICDTACCRRLSNLEARRV